VTHEAFKIGDRVTLNLYQADVRDRYRGIVIDYERRVDDDGTEYNRVHVVWRRKPRRAPSDRWYSEWMLVHV
jgi:hypothetical protein